MEAMSASYHEQLALMQAKLDAMAAHNAKLAGQAATFREDEEVR